MRWYGRTVAVLTGLIALGLISVVWAAPLEQANLFQLFQQNVRSDLELLANEVYGEGERPELWTGNDDLQSANFSPDLWFDNEILADEVFGEALRPDGWIGATSRNDEILVRNVRHDLELTADSIYGVDLRPDEWIGAPRIFQCSRTLQNLLRIMDIEYDVRPDVPESVVDYCSVVKLEIEDELFNNVLSSSSFEEDTQELISGLRGDLERTADELLGLDTRPEGWTGNRNEATDTFLTDIFDDLQRLADDQFGVGVRPDEWTATLTTSDISTYRNLRFNLELLTDETLGEDVRPRGWQGLEPLASCDDTLQTLVFLVDLNYATVPIPPAENFEFRQQLCLEVERLANDLAENPPEPDDVVEQLDPQFLGRSRYAFAYLDVAALDYMGVMPYDTEFRAWYRNFAESDMMFVSGQNFAVFIDRRWTDLPESVFNRLPTLEGRRPLTFCDARWCNGPGPTPTPTGGGPVLAILNASTPPATPDFADLEEQGKVLVSWNNIRVNYLLDRPELGVVQVTLEICADPSQIACEPVISIFDGNSGTFKPVIQQFNGLNVYELAYGYQTNLTIEGATRYSRDVWISDPSIR